jgi:hypothetical protein
VTLPGRAPPPDCIDGLTLPRRYRRRRAAPPLFTPARRPPQGHQDCLQTEGNTSSGVYRRSSPSWNVHQSPFRSGPVADFPAVFTGRFRSSPGTLQYRPPRLRVPPSAARGDRRLEIPVTDLILLFGHGPDGYGIEVPATCCDAAKPNKGPASCVGVTVGGETTVGDDCRVSVTAGAPKPEPTGRTTQ